MWNKEKSNKAFVSLSSNNNFMVVLLDPCVFRAVIAKGKEQNELKT